MGANGATVSGSALNGGAPALCLAVAGGQSGDHAAANNDLLGVVATGGLVNVVESDGRSCVGGGTLSLDGLLSGVYIQKYVSDIAIKQASDL